MLLRPCARDVRGLLIGTAVDLAALKAEPVYQETLRRKFSLRVTENAFKPHALEKVRYL